MLEVGVSFFADMTCIRIIIWSMLLIFYFSTDVRRALRRYNSNYTDITPHITVLRSVGG